jgi:hypothetical protein
LNRAVFALGDQRELLSVGPACVAIDAVADDVGRAADEPVCVSVPARSIQQVSIRLGPEHIHVLQGRIPEPADLTARARDELACGALDLVRFRSID